MGTSPVVAKVTVLVSDHKLLWADSRGRGIRAGGRVARVCLEKRLRPGVSQAACGGPSTFQPHSGRPRLLCVLTSRPCSLFPGTHLSRLEFETQSPVCRGLDLQLDREARGHPHPVQRPPQQGKALNSVSLSVTRESGSPSCSCHKGRLCPGLSLCLRILPRCLLASCHPRSTQGLGELGWPAAGAAPSDGRIPPLGGEAGRERHRLL